MNVHCTQAVSEPVAAEWVDAMIRVSFVAQYYTTAGEFLLALCIALQH